VDSVIGGLLVRHIRAGESQAELAPTWLKDVNAVFEIDRQFRSLGKEPDYIYLSGANITRPEWRSA
jgi:hypothetical protein